eukprot:c28833_g1_i3 orf=339-2225(-)
MNLSLLDPFQSDFPEVIEEYLEHGFTKCIAFNRRGTLLAAGGTGGTCVIWDFDTRGVATELQNKDCCAVITSVSWSKCGHRLLAAATDKSLTLWDIAQGAKIASVTLQQTALHARLHPGSASPTLCLACPMSSAPLLVDFATGMTYVLPVSPLKAQDAVHHGRNKTNDGTVLYSPAAASFNKRGDLIYVGNSKGEILIIETETRQVQSIVQVPGGAVIRQIVFSRSGQYLLLNSNDRVIRVFENLLPRDKARTALAELVNTLGGGNTLENLKLRGCQCLTLTKDFQDAVNRMHWKAACFNGDGEFVVGASASKGEHKIHIWNRKFGQLARILEGPKEGLADLAWHPTRPIVASVSMSGVVFLWAKDYTENWSAFAPDFQELEENEEYVEREDEFDMMPDTDKVKPARVDEDEEVDIMTTEKVAAYSDSDDSQDGLYFLPTTPLPDTPEQQNPTMQSSDVPSKEQNSSPSESERSPLVDEDEKANPSEPSHCQVLESLAEGEIGPNGRGKRKRKLSEKAAEYQAEKGRKSTKKSRVSTPRQKIESTGLSTVHTDYEDFAVDPPSSKGKFSVQHEFEDIETNDGNEAGSARKVEDRVLTFKSLSSLTSSYDSRTPSPLTESNGFSSRRNI